MVELKQQYTFKDKEDNIWEVPEIDLNFAMNVFPKYDLTSISKNEENPEGHWSFISDNPNKLIEEISKNGPFAAFIVAALLWESENVLLRKISNTLGGEELASKTIPTKAEHAFLKLFDMQTTQGARIALLERCSDFFHESQTFVENMIEAMKKLIKVQEGLTPTVSAEMKKEVDSFIENLKTEFGNSQQEQESDPENLNG
tara:strand:+ start:1628 stop:2230 length:603 start_codon:yes stop_codon:yes gene_type:complete